MLRLDRIGATALLTIDRPARRNALSMALRAEFVAALERVEADRAIRAVVITGAGGTFSAGGDITDMDATDFAAGRERFRTSHRLVRMLIESAKPVIAAVEGWAVGAGFGVALCCDSIVAAENASFMAGFGRIGLVADFGLLHTLPRRIGEGRARQMLIHNTALAAPEAERIGLVDRLAPPGGALAVALDLAKALEQAAPLPIAMTKSFLAQGLADSLEWERTAQSAMFLTADHAEGKAAFLEKRPPVFHGT